MVTHNDGRSGFTGGLIQNAIWDQKDDATTRTDWVLYLERETASLFASDGYTLIDWEQRLGLPPLAKWLHSFYFSHREPFNMKVETLYLLCGSKCKELRAFRFLLKKALAKLVEAGFLTGFSYDPKTDLVAVTRVKRIAT